MSTHTKGPWVVEAGGPRLINTHARVISAADGLGPVAYATGENARLVSAAPDLLDALWSIKTRLLDAIKAGCTAEEAYDSFYQDLIEEALVKATGGAS